MGLLQRLFGKKDEPLPQPKAPTPPEPPQKAPEQPAEAKQEEKPIDTRPPIGASVLGTPDGYPNDYQFWILPELRNRHLYLIGKTRTGKTTLIKNLALQDMASGFGVVFIDPHGDAALDLIGSIPKERIKDVIYFDPISPYAPSLNILNLPFPAYKIVDDVISCFKLFFESWGVQLEYILSRSLSLLLVQPKPYTLLDIRKLLVSENFRAHLLQNVSNEGLRSFWEDEFPTLKNAINPILNKFSSFSLPDSPMERIFSQPENDLDFSRILQEQKILIVNLSKGLLGEQGSKLLGGLIVTAINQSAMARQELPPDQRKECVMYLDEFQNFAVDSMASILSESAKYKLYLTLAHQTLGQVSSTIRSSIFGNIASMVAFGISADDASVMQREMHRTRPLIRQRATGNEIAADEFMDFARKTLKEEYARYDEQARTQKNGIYYKMYECNGIEELLSLIDNPNVTRDHLLNKLFSFRVCTWYEDGYIEHVPNPHRLEGFEHEHTVIKQTEGILLFPGYDFHETTYPAIDDFINLKPRHAFARCERAENVALFRTFPAPEPVTEISGQILHAMQEAHAERMKHRAKESPPPSNGLDGSTSSPQDTQAPATEEPEGATATAQPQKKPSRSVPKTPPKTEEEFEF